MGMKMLSSEERSSLGVRGGMSELSEGAVRRRNGRAFVVLGGALLGGVLAACGSAVSDPPVDDDAVGGAGGSLGGVEGVGGSSGGEAGSASGGGALGGRSGYGGEVEPRLACLEGFDPESISAPLAEVTLTLVSPPAVRLGEGVDSATGALLGVVCAEGTWVEPKGSGVTVTSFVAGATLGVGGVDSTLPHETEEAFVSRLEETAARSLYRSSSVFVSAAGYTKVFTERVEDAEPCGDRFVRSATPARGLTVALRLTFPTAEERDKFPHPQVLSGSELGETRCAERYLVEHDAELEIAVLQAAGDFEATEALMVDHQCSVANLKACWELFSRLSEQSSSFVEAPPTVTSVEELPGEWGLFRFSTSPYEQIP